MRILMIPMSADALRSATAPEKDAADVFGGGPPLGRFRTALGLTQRVVRNSLVVAALGWVPLSVMTALQALLLGDGSFRAFMTDYGVLARSLIAAPLLVIGEGIAAPRLAAIARYFRDAGLLGGLDLGRFNDILRSTRRLRDSTLADIAIVAAALLLAAAATWGVPLTLLPSWHRMGGMSYTVSLAGWWHQFVSIPILFLLLLGWLWRLALWTRFLWLVSRLDLLLIPSHPDGAAGLKFVGLSLQALAVPVFAAGAVLAGTIANRIVHDHQPVIAFHRPVLMFAGVALAMTTGPLLLFCGRLLATMQRGAFEYGAMARDMGRCMEKRWLGGRIHEGSLDVGDFSATTDLYSIVSNAYTMNIVPISLKNLLVVVAAALLPFLPVALTVFSPEDLMKKVSGFFL
jgi:hypothetical protein